MLKYWYIRYPNIKFLLRERVRSSQKVLGCTCVLGAPFIFTTSCAKARLKER